jgi:hypothetical protein
MAKFAGKFGTITYGGTLIRVTEWTADHEAKWLDATDTGSAGFQEGEFGYESINGTLKILLGSGADESLATLPIGQAAVTMVLAFAPGVTWHTFQAKIDTHKPRMNHAALIEADVTFKSQGAIT